MSDPAYPLAVAVAKFFAPESGVTVSSLRTEIRKGRLIPERIAGKLLVTEQAIKDMRDRCRELPKPRACTSATEPTEDDTGSSSTKAGSLALAAAKQTVTTLKRRSRGTSPKNTRRRGAKGPSIVCLLPTSSTST
jgi:hypothetical protein